MLLQLNQYDMYARNSSKPKKEGRKMIRRHGRIHNLPVRRRKELTTSPLKGTQPDYEANKTPTERNRICDPLEASPFRLEPAS